jgi:hypothetical protein
MEIRKATVLKMLESMKTTYDENMEVIKKLKPGREYDDWRGTTEGLNDVRLKVMDYVNKTETKNNCYSDEPFLKMDGELRKGVNEKGNAHFENKSPAYKSGYLYGIEQGRGYIDALYITEDNHRREKEKQFNSNSIGELEMKDAGMWGAEEEALKEGKRKSEFEQIMDMDDDDKYVFSNNPPLEKFSVPMGGEMFDCISEPGKLTLIDPRKDEAIEIAGKFDNKPFLTQLNDSLLSKKYDHVTDVYAIWGVAKSDYSALYALQINEHKPANRIDYQEKKGPLDHQIEIARKTGYVQGVCECVAAIGDDHTLGKKLLTEMNVTKDIAKSFANPETFKAMEQGIFAMKPEQTLVQTHGRRQA